MVVVLEGTSPVRRVRTALPLDLLEPDQDYIPPRAKDSGLGIQGFY